MLLYLNQYGISNLLGLGITPDFKNSKYNILGIYPTILSLPDRDYYLNPKKKKYLTRLKKFIEDLLKIADLKIDVKKISKEIISFQKKMAKNKMKKEELRDPKKVYNIYTIEKLRKEFPSFFWDSFFTACQIKTKEIIIEDINYLKEFVNLFNSTPIDILKCMMIYNFIMSVSSTMDDSVEELVFNFYNKYLSGQKERKSKWKRSIEFVSGQLGEVFKCIMCD